jgi:hypothetical protein
MRRSHPSPHSDVPVSPEISCKLFEASLHCSFVKEDWEIAEEAILEWMQRHDPATRTGPATSGYQWKKVFLPDGTVLRTIFGGTNHHCVVKGDAILYEGKPVSPSVFVNAVGGIRRNAWRCVWILFPDATYWALADSLRGTKTPRRARQPRPAPPPSAPPAAPSSSAVPPRGPSRAAQRAGATSAAMPAPDANAAAQRRPDALDRRIDRRSAGPRQGAAPASAPSADDALLALLRQQLLPLLCRRGAAGTQRSILRE